MRHPWRFAVLLSLCVHGCVLWWLLPAAFLPATGSAARAVSVRIAPGAVRHGAMASPAAMPPVSRPVVPVVSGVPGRTVAAGPAPAVPAAVRGGAESAARDVAGPVSGAQGDAGAGGDDEGPRLVYQGDKLYPARAREYGQTGVVGLLLSVDAQGQVAAVRVVTRSGYAELDEAARRWAAGWRFQPARHAGQSVPGQVTVRVRYDLSDPD